ncbi:CHAT domain-containing protein [Marinoscillum sp. MHG1-6]|uniref:CHAT domain-containing protein n=1 Tax=Marinoscillum sp. MHG1-6 TaxID=2959627 RepID=UPI0021570E70|nr:CHAT domain-containing protein [Marinoscillum sp. MHG1-6]
MKRLVCGLLFSIVTFTAVSQDWAVAYQNAVDLYNNYDSEQALVEANRSLELYKAAVPADDKNLGAILRQLSIIYYDLDQPDDALDYAKHEVDLLQTLNLNTNINYANALHNLAVIRMARSEYGAAEPLIRASLVITKSFYSLDTYEVAIAQGNLAVVLFQLKKDDEALELFETALNVLDNLEEVGADYYLIAYNCASLLLDRSRFAGALGYFQIIEDYYNYNTPNLEYGSILIKVGDVLDELGRYEQSAIKYQLAVDNFSQMNAQNSEEYTIALNNLTIALQKTGKFNQARSLVTELLDQKKAKKNEAPASYASTLANYANLLIRDGNNSGAEKALLEAMEIYEVYSLDQDLTYTNILESLSSINLANGNFESANSYVDEAITLVESRDYQSRTYALNNLKSKILARQGKYKTSRQLASKSLEQSITRFGSNAIQTASVKASLATIVSQLGDFSYAENLYLEVLPLFKTTYGESHPETAKIMTNYSSLLQLKGNYYQAESYLKQALNIKRNAFGENNPDYLITYENLAILYQNTARYTAALEILEKILSIKENSSGAHDPSLAFTYMNLGNAKKQMADYLTAEKYLRKAREIYGATVGTEHLFYTSSLDALALLYQKMGNTASAKPLFRQALTIYEKHLGKQTLDYATTLENLATTYQMEDNPTEAKKLLEEVLVIDQQILGTEHPLYSKTLHNLAAIYEQNNEYAQAESLYLKALAIDEKVFGQEHPSYASTLYNLAVLEQELEKYEEATLNFQRVLRIRKNILGENHPDYVYSLYGLAHIYHRTGNFEAAKAPFTSIIENYLQQIKKYFPALSESEKSAFYGKIRPVLESYMDYAVEFILLEKGTPQDRSQMIGSLYNLQLATKALLLNASNKVRNRINSSGNQELVDLFNGWIALKENIVKAYSMSREELVKAGIDISQMERVANDKEKELSMKSSVFAAEFEQAVVEWQDVQARLLDDESAIEIIRIKKKMKVDSVLYVSLILNGAIGSTPQIMVNANGVDLEGKNFKLYKNSVIYKVQDTKSYAAYWEMVARSIGKNTSEIYLSADGVFNKVNITTLYDPDQKEYVLDKYKIRLLSNTRELAEPTGAENSNNMALLFGYPKYNLTAAEQAKTASLITDEETRYSFGENVSELPGTLEEINNIESILAGNQWTYQKYLQALASEDQIKQLQSPKILHVATHGFFLSDIQSNNDDAGLDSRSTRYNPLMRSGLLLAGAENTIRNESFEGKEDGILTAYEAMNLNLDNTDLVIMSACETGLGEVKNGEGVYGLQRAFIVAGASNLIMSLWKVNDATTQLLMTQFYKNWFKGQSRLDAFNNAILEVKNEFKEPYYWGAFVILGK